MDVDSVGSVIVAVFFICHGLGNSGIALPDLKQKCNEENEGTTSLETYYYDNSYYNNSYMITHLNTSFHNLTRYFTRLIDFVEHKL